MDMSEVEDEFIEFETDDVIHIVFEVQKLADFKCGVESLHLSFVFYESLQLICNILCIPSIIVKEGY